MLTLLSTIADFLCTQYGWTALMVSASDGHTDTVKALVQHGADINIQDKVSRGVVSRGWTVKRD